MLRLERRIAAAMQDKLGIAAEQARRVDAQRQIAVDARFGAVSDYAPSASRSTQPLFMRSAAGEAARPPAGAARPFAFGRPRRFR